MKNARQRMCIVRRKLRIQRLICRQGNTCAGQIGHIGVRLAREYWVALKTQLLSQFDFGVPVRTFD